MIKLFGRMRDRVANPLGESGAVLVVVSVAFVTLIGFAAIALDGGVLFNEKRHAQNAADHAALAAAWANCNGEDPAAAADASVVKNGYVAAELTLTDNDPSYTAQVDTSVDMTFAKIFGISSAAVSADAVAECVVVSGGGFGPLECVLALDPSADDALVFSSIDIAELNDCTPIANSTSSSAIKLRSMGSFCAYSLYTPGGVDAPGYLLGCLDEPPTTGSSATASDDPFADVIPTLPGSPPCASTSGNILLPGVYCNGLSKSSLGTLTLEPGTYYIIGALSFSSIDTVECNCPDPGDGVSLIMLGSGARFSFSSIDNVSLQSPSAGDYPGMLLYVDPNTTESTSGFTSIDRNWAVNGAIYSASQKLTFSSIDDTTGSLCTPIVGNTVAFTSIDGVGHNDPTVCDDFGLGGGGGADKAFLME